MFSSKSVTVSGLIFRSLIDFYFFFVVLKGLPCSSNGKDSACNAGDWGSIPGSGRSSGEGNGNPL